MYLILLILGLLLGAVFLVVLLIGDRREARLEAQKRALREQVAAASARVEGVWPPPSATALPPVPPPASPSKPLLSPRTSRYLIWAVFRWRIYAAGTVIAAYVIYSSYPRLGFGRVLLCTALAAAVLGAGITKLRKSRRSTGR